MMPPTPAEIWKLAINAAIEIVADQPVARAQPVSPFAPVIHRLQQLRDRGPELPGVGAPAVSTVKPEAHWEAAARDARRWRALAAQACVTKDEDANTLLVAQLYGDEVEELPGATPNEQLAIDGEAHEAQPGIFCASVAGADRVNRIVDAWIAKAGGA